MTSNFRKFLLLLWKNYILQKRHKLGTFMELMVPVFFAAFLVGIRGSIPSDNVTEPTIFYPFDVNDVKGTSVAKGCVILYAPNTSALTIELMESPDSPMYQTYFPRTPENYTVIGYETEEELLSEYRKGGFHDCKGVGSPDKNRDPVLAAIIFNDGLDHEEWSSVRNIKYSLRFPASQHSADENAYEQPRWMTELLYPVFQILGPREAIENMGLEDYPENENEHHGGEPGYWIEGFLYTQNAVEASIRKFMENGNSNSSINIQLERMPYPPFIDDVFLVILKDFLPMILVFSFINSVINITKSITLEKEKRLKESMKMMGLPNWLHWLAWFIKSYLLILISIGMMAPLITARIYNGGELAILTKSNVTLILAFLLNYAFSMVTLSFLVSTLFSSANSAATGAGVFFFVSYLPYTFLQTRYNTLSKAEKLSASFLSNTGLSFGCQLIAMWEGTGVGVQWGNLNELASPDDNWTFLDLNLMLLADGVLYLLIALYIEGVWPGEFGLPMPWYFPFTKWYWIGTSRGEHTVLVKSADARQEKPQNFEKEPNSKAGVQIQGLTKVFGPKTAVNNLYLNMYENQITALLGHNGAGKTTTMSMLTGLFPSTSGTAIVNGYDIRTDIKFVRENLGLCPQHNVLFDEMTVLEHLQFFGRLKGSKSLNKEVARMLKAINLEDKKHVQSQALSGGMKRRLSLGIAFVGGSSVVLLDEPTSGLDPGARRQIWDLIQQEKKNRTIILSTHFMDEADLLSDRLAIMADGQVQCCGSSLFLKKKYGGGYQLIIVKKPDCDVNRITSFLKKRIPNIEIQQNVGSELSYSLSDELSPLFPDMFEAMEQHKVELGIDSYGCSITTMEEVFMRVGKEAEEEFRLRNGKNASIPVEIHSLNLHSQRNSGIPLLLQQTFAMIVKKFLYTIRNQILIAVQTIIPIAFLIITLVMLKSQPNLTNPPGMDLNLGKYTQYGQIYTVMNCPTNPGLPNVCSAYKNTAESFGSEILERENIYETLIQTARDNLPSYAYGHIAAMSDLSSPDNITYRGFFNNQPYHGPPVALNLINNALLQSSSGLEDAFISVSNHPLPLDQISEIKQSGSMQSSGFQVGFAVSFGMSFLAASFVVFLIKERETNAKHLQVVSGVRFPIFWIASFLFDAVNYIVPCIGLIIVFAAFQHEDFKSVEMLGNVALLLLAYGASVIPLMYLFSFRYKIPASGFTRMVMFNIFTGIICMLTVSILQIEELGAQKGAEVCEWVFMVLPNFNLGYGLLLLSANHQLHSICPDLLNFNETCVLYPDLSCCVDYPIPYLGWDARGIGRNLTFSGGLGVVCFVIIFIKESKILGWIRYYVCCHFRAKGNESSAQNAAVDEEGALVDSDVLLENMRIRNTKLKQMNNTDNLILRDLTKIYGGNFKAVDNLCVGVQKGECFGLLGINGAGKSTTFKMLTGDIPVTSGNAFIDGHSVKTEIKKVQQNLGYCPQFDALIPELTGRETIRLFARLRGVHEGNIENLANTLAARLIFDEHIDKPCGTYSGGNKRKLSTALALVGNPPMVLLDEPTTGMDPVARRHLWDVISEVRNSGTSIVLTSHSMDECEALSTRIAIMVNGGFRCLGSPQHLKNKFGEGYTLIAQIEMGIEERRLTRQSLEFGRRRSSNLRKGSGTDFLAQPLQPWEKELLPLRNYIEATFPGSELKDIHAGYVHYHIKNTAIGWGYMFKKMEEAKSTFKIEAYSVGQTSLEQVFLNFSKTQINLDEQ